MNKLERSELLNLQEDLAEEYKYKALDKDKSEYYRNLWLENLPEGLCVDGANIPIYTNTGELICSGYNRIVIGDYGAFIEFLPEQANKDAYRIKEGQEYRVNNPRYMYNVKYNWLTIEDTDLKIYEQKKTVAYADYKAGRYYISPHEKLIFGYRINSEKKTKGSITLNFDVIPNNCGECPLYMDNVYVDDEPMWGDGVSHSCPFGSSYYGCLVERPKDCPIKIRGGRHDKEKSS